jgi:hypothetical protein
MEESQNNFLYAVLALFVGIPSLSYKFLDDIVSFEQLTKVCSGQFHTVEEVDKGRRIWNRWRYETITISTDSGKLAVLHGNIAGYERAKRAVNSESNSCIWFDEIGNSKSIYQVEVDGHIVIGYKQYVADRQPHINFFFFIGLVGVFVAFPTFIFKWFKFRSRRSRDH